MSYHQITSEERYMISTYRMQGLCSAQIARRLGRHRSTISREVSRNQTVHDNRYRAAKAIEKASGRRSRSRRYCRFTPQQWSIVCHLLKEQWSPEQVSGYLRRTGKLCISHETIYRYVWHDRWMGGQLYRHLRQSLKGRRKRYRAYSSRGMMLGKRRISERPEAVERRRQFGHWEIDTVLGSGAKDCVVTLVERKSGQVLIGKLRNKTSVGLSNRVIKMMRACSTPFKSITADNGTEFYDYKTIEDATNVKFYFANPYQSWERGTNENANGLIRQYIPKRTSMAKVTQNQCTAIAKKLNTRPRKRHNYRTPLEVLDARR